MIERCESTDDERWLALRRQLWPSGSDEQHREQMRQLAPRRNDFAAFLFIRAEPLGEPLGLAEVSVRRDYVNGCASSPVAFLEGLYVSEPARRHGIARALVDAAEAWARSRGFSEFASDARLENDASHAVHASLGFEETERVVFFRKALR